MTKQHLKKVKDSLSRINTLKKQTETLKDSLREEISQLEDILNSVEEANELLNDGLRAFDDAVMELSKYV